MRIVRGSQSDDRRSGEARAVALSLERGCLLRDGREIRLRAKTFQVLVYLYEHQGHMVAKEDLFRAVWPDTFVSDDSLTKCVHEIRDALGDHDRQLLKTVPRRGFILDVPLATVESHRENRPSPAAAVKSRTHNLPVSLTTFIGRQQEITELSRLLPTTRLLTLTGAGGCGKTRLALEVARARLDRFPDGVWLVDLAPLSDPALVAQTVASVLDIRQVPNRSFIDTLVDQLHSRRLLLILDNCEHLIAPSAELADGLLRGVEGITILATSREALGIVGETTWRVPSLTVPDVHQGAGAIDLLQYEGVRLLAERAAAVDSRLKITRDNAGIVAEVCRRLDGIPLAIELAAARLRVLSIEQIHARLHDRFRLLAQADRIGRQRTLEATVDWSYDLLSDAERLLLRRLSVFAGGWTLEAAEAVCGGDGIARDDVLDLMSRLIDKSLVLVEQDSDGQRRYRCLETVRHYGSERMQQTAEADTVRARHFSFFLELARRAEPELTKAAQLHWLNRLQLEHDNLRAALEWRLVAVPSGLEGLELALALHWFWMKRAYLAEAQNWLERAMAGSTALPKSRHAETLLALGNTAFFQGQFERARALLEEGATLARASGSPAIEAHVLGMLSLTMLEGGDLEGAAGPAAASAAAARAANHPWLKVFALSYSGYAALHAGDIDRAGQLQEEALALLRTHGELWGMGIVLFDLGLLRLVQHRHAEARALCAEAIAIGQQFGDRRAIAWSLGVFAGADAAEGHALRAARLRGAMEGLLDSVGAPVQPTYHTWVGDRLFGAVQQELGTEMYERTLLDGRAMSVSQAIEYAMGGR
jgi:non-specific serine/threonine protein kinase